VWAVAVAGLVGGAGSVGVIRAANERTAGIERVAGLGDVLAGAGNRPGDDPASTIDLDTPVTYAAQNYLLVGSDSRAGIGGDFIGTEADVGGQRSDTIMILHQEHNGGAALISVPRDLWVPIYGKDRSNRVNAAFGDGPLTLVATVSEALDIPIHHYVEVDFQGFQNVIDRLGGVEICVTWAAKDDHSGLSLNQGCNHLNGTQALAYARSRYYEEFRDDQQWHTDGRADLGRIERQQLFIRATVSGVLRRLESSPFEAGEMISAVTAAVRIDDSLEPLRAAKVLRQAFQTGIRTFALPVYNDTVGDAAVLRMSDEAAPLLAYLRGAGPAPVGVETSQNTGGAGGFTPATLPTP